MRVSLIHPRLIYKPSQPPLGLGYIAACLENAGHEVQFIEGAFTDSDDDIARQVKEFGAQIVGISVMISYYSKSLHLGRKLKEVVPDVPLVYGGPHPSVVPDDFIKEDCVDYVIKGEGEDSFTQIVTEMAERQPFDPTRIAGLAWKGGQAAPDHAVRITTLDRLPWPARHLLPMDQYVHRENTVSFGFHGGNFNIITTRGCPYKCNFCDHSVFGRKTLSRNIKDVVDEIEYTARRYNIRNFDVMDDTFTLNPLRVFELCEEILRRDLRLFWASRVRVTGVSREMLEIMARAGCIRFSLGIESADERVIKYMGKGIKLEQVVHVLRWAKEFDFLTIGNFMIGNIGDDRESVAKTIKFAVETDEIDIPSFVILVPLPGTEVFEIGKRNGWIRSFDWDEYRMNSKDVPLMRNEALDYPDLQELYASAAAAVRPKIRRAFDTLHWPRLKLYPELRNKSHAAPTHEVCKSYGNETM